MKKWLSTGVVCLLPLAFAGCGENEYGADLSGKDEEWTGNQPYEQPVGDEPIHRPVDAAPPLPPPIATVEGADNTGQAGRIDQNGRIDEDTEARMERTEFAAFDTNANGELDKGEWPTERLPGIAFEAADDDGNGAVDHREFMQIEDELHPDRNNDQ